MFLSFESITVPDYLAKKMKMNGYSRIRKVTTASSKSIDISDLYYQHENKKSNFNTQESKQMWQDSIPEEGTDISDSISNHDECDGGVEEVFGVVLTRNSSVSSVSSSKQGKSVKTSIRRAFSMKGSSASSMSDTYCRVLHRCDPPAVDEDVKNKRKTKWFKNCKSLLGL